jgi:magnesium transporter
MQQAIDHLNQSVMEHARTDFARISVDRTVGEALDEVRVSNIGGRIVYFYVLDDEGRLCGVIPTRALLLSAPDVAVRDVMVKSVITVPPTATLFDACELFILHRLLAFPIVDADRRMIGVIDVERYTHELLDLGDRELSNDIFQIIGVRLAQVQKASLPRVIRFRLPWLLCNIAGGLACAVLANQFDWLMQEVIALALFIPIVLALGESVSIQSLTLTLQAHHGAPKGARRWLRELTAELPVGLVLGAATGGIVAMVVWLWLGLPWVAASILLSVTLAVATAALLGLAVPAVLWSLQRDPQVAAGPITLTLTDLATLGFYFGIAAALLG